MLFPSFNPLAPAFAEAHRVAANIPAPGEAGDYTSAMFLADHPEFKNAQGTALVPTTVLDMFIAQANDSILPSRWGTAWRYAAGLYVAHFASMYLKTYEENSPNSSAVARKAEQSGAVKRVQMGDTNIEYDNAAVTSATAEWGAWNATTYGQQLATMMRLVGMGGTLAI